MSGDELRIATDHLDRLAVQQANAAAVTRSATVAVEGVDAAVRGTHGTIAAEAASALEAVLPARHRAGMRMAAISADLSEKLADAAKRYDRVDDAAGGVLDTQMGTRWS